MRSAVEAVAYARTLHALVRWIDICDGNMQEGSFRCDANVSVRPAGEAKLGTRCEIKNLNSFRFLERAILFEARRQIELLQDGGRVVQETRLYDPDRDETRSMRSKEDAQDYRYFPDPDLPTLVLDHKWIEQVRTALPELPHAKRERFQHELQLSGYDAALLTADRETAAYFESALIGLPEHPKLIANWITGELSSRLNKQDLTIERSRITPAELASLLRRIADGTISGKIAKKVFERMWETGESADRIIEQDERQQISDASQIESIVDGIIAANPAQVAEYRAGKEKAFNFLVGQAMKASAGRANPAQVNAILKSKLLR
jgi:aspartyl-tRNA(Asn)/glutamyl-tRNA(Gln) amidotransferase subunit B